MRCLKCRHENDSDAKFCEKCGSPLSTAYNSGNSNNETMKTSTKVLIIIVVILVAGLGVTSGMLMQMNKAGTAGTIHVTNSSPVSQSVSPTSTNAQYPPSTNAQYKSFSNTVIYFQYPSSWNVLPNTDNTMAIVGFSSYPAFKVYDESKYGHTSLSDYISSSKNQMTNNGYSILSEQSNTVDGLPADEIIYEGKNSKGVMIIQQMELVEKSPGSQYFALVRVDNANNFDQNKNTFNQIVDSFHFLS